MLGLEKHKSSDYLEIIKDKWQEVINLFQKREEVDLEKGRLEEERIAFLQIIKKAKEDWEEAQNYFTNVSNPDLVDLAIHRMEAARIFYMYLLKEAKKKGISA